MERKINNLSICFILFLIILFLSGSLTGAMQELVYVLALVIPLIVGLKMLPDDNSEKSLYLSLKKKDVKFFLPLIFPTVYLVLVLSLVTALVLSLMTGKESTGDVGDAIIPALLVNALLPAVLEEALFRYLPMRMLSGHSKRVTVLVSAAFFALIHHDLFSLPYAFFAGVIFMMIDLACDSVIPSMIIHFVNNAISVGLLIYNDTSLVGLTILYAVRILSLVSVIYLVINRREYIERLLPMFKKGERVKLTTPAVLLGAICLIIAVFSIVEV